MLSDYNAKHPNGKFPYLKNNIEMGIKLQYLKSDGGGQSLWGRLSTMSNGCVPLRQFLTNMCIRLFCMNEKDSMV